MKGRAEGRTEGRVTILLKLLALRFGPLSESAQSRIRDASDVQLDVVAERVLTAQTLEEALTPMSPDFPLLEHSGGA